MNEWQNYLNNLKDDRKAELVVKVLETALNHVPEAIKAMSYGVPGLKLSGKNLIAVAAHKEHLGVYPFSPEVVANISGKNKNHSSKGTLKYPFDNPPSNLEIREIVILRKKEIEKRLS